MPKKDAAAVAMGKKRWAGKSKRERKLHGQMMAHKSALARRAKAEEDATERSEAGPEGE